MRHHHHDDNDDVLPPHDSRASRERRLQVYDLWHVRGERTPRGSPTRPHKDINTDLIIATAATLSHPAGASANSLHIMCSTRPAPIMHARAERGLCARPPSPHMPCMANDRSVLAIISRAVTQLRHQRSCTDRILSRFNVRTVRLVKNRNAVSLVAAARWYAYSVF